MTGISFRKINITGGFWKKRMELNKNVTVNAVYDRFYDTGRIEAFNFEENWSDEKKPHFFWDSDVAKWLEAVYYILEKENMPDIEEKAKRLLDLIEKNQCEDGYFNIYFTVVEPENRFKGRGNHELYCAGHLMEAAAAHYKLTGSTRFIDIMSRYTDYIIKVFAVEKSAGFVTPGHEEIELALIKMYDVTGDDKYLNLCKFFINSRGVAEEDDIGSHGYINIQSHLPVRSQKTAEGHCVRACYLYSGMADLAEKTGDAKLLAACKEIFDDITERKMYITGGIGSTYMGEAFTIPYDLPNETAYAETCAAVSLAYFANRMLKNDINSKYADTVEKIIYNGSISGVSLDGKAFFYENPLEINLDDHNKDKAAGNGEKTRLPLTQRKEVFACSCCPPNITRFIASIGDYAAGEDKENIYIHQYMESEIQAEDGVVKIETDYPVSGKVKIWYNGKKNICVRIPSWCGKYSLSEEYTDEKNGYIKVKSREFSIVFDMKPTVVRCTSKVKENIGRAAVQMGPVVYCLEGIDNGKELYRFCIDGKTEFEIKFDEFFGANVIEASGYEIIPQSALYMSAGEQYAEKTLKFIPYFGFANRGETDMIVWVNHR